MSYCADIPYPEIIVERKDINLAKEILNSYAGRISEDNAIHNYIFQEMMQSDTKIKEILKGIAIVEMHHLEILGKLISSLGLTPVFASINDNHTKWFSGSYINYEKNWQQILIDNIFNEEVAIRNYEKIIATTADNNVKHILKRIILDERIHIEIFTNLLKQIV